MSMEAGTARILEYMLLMQAPQTDTQTDKRTEGLARETGRCRLVC